MNWLSFDDLKVGMNAWVKDGNTHKATKVKIVAIAGMVSLPEKLYGINAFIFPVVCETGNNEKVVIEFVPCRFYKHKCLLEKDKYAVEV